MFIWLYYKYILEADRSLLFIILLLWKGEPLAGPQETDLLLPEPGDKVKF